MSYLDINIFFRTVLDGVEIRNLWRQVCGLPGKFGLKNITHALSFVCLLRKCEITRVPELLSQFPMTLRHPVMMTKSQSPGQEADQLVHFRFEVLAATEKFPDEDVTRGISLLDKLGHHALHGSVVIAFQIILRLASLKPLNIFYNKLFFW